MLFLEKLEQKRIYIISAMVICILIGIIYSTIFISKEYVASSTLLVVKNEENSGASVGNLELSNNLMSTFEEIIKSDSTIQSVKDNIKIDIDTNKLKNNIDVKRVKDSDTFEITFKNLNSELAQNVTNEIVKTFSYKLEKMYSNTHLYIVDKAHIVGKVYQIPAFYIIGISIIIGLCINILYIILLIQMEKKVKTNFDIESEINLKNLMSIPLKCNKENKIITELMYYESDKSNTVKAFNNLRSNIQFINVNNKDKNIILVTSPFQKEGKSYIAANMAISFAKVGKKVILIDADLINGRQGKIFNIPNDLGFSNYLSNLDNNGVEINERINKFINETEIKNLNVITSGTIPPNSSELLTSPKLPELIKDLSIFYDVIIIDGTSILKTTDSLILTRVANSTIIVSEYKKTKKDDLWKAKRDVLNVGGRIIGIVFNKVKIKDKKNIRKESKIVLLNVENKIKISIDKIKKCFLQRKPKLLNEANIEELDNLKKDNTNKIVHKKEKNIRSETNYQQEDLKNKDNENINVKEKTGLIDRVISKTKKIDENNKTVEIKNDEKENTKINNKLISQAISEAPSIDIEKKITEENSGKVENKIIEKNETIEKIKLDFESSIDNMVSNLKRATSNSKEFFEKSKLVIGSQIQRFKQVDKEIEKENTENQNIELQTNKTNQKKSQTKIENENLENKIENKFSEEENEKNVLVIVDAENGVCRAFSKECYMEKLARGLDKLDGFVKAHYSFYLMNKRVEGLMKLYDLTKKQARRIDPLIYTTLCDYDECVWLEKKMISNKAESYVISMTKEYDKNAGESSKNYKLRCQKLRKELLENYDLEIEYKLEFLWKSEEINFSDKVVINMFAKILGTEKNEICDKNNMNVQGKVQEKIEHGNKKKTIEKVEELEYNINPITNTNYTELKNVVANKNISGNFKSNIEKKNKKEINDNNYNERIEKIKEEKSKKEERKREIEVLKKVKREKNEIKKIERKKKKDLKKEEKSRMREENKKKREFEKMKQKEEARIEEELLVDNLYPKTKNNKNL